MSRPTRPDPPTPCCSNRWSISKPKVCPHLRSFKEKGGLESFQTIQHYIQACKHSLFGKRLAPPECFSCRDHGAEIPSQPYFFRRLHACLECIFIGCWLGGHLKAHFESTQHCLAVDVDHSQIYCNTCGDYCYDYDFDGVVLMERTNALVALHRGKGGEGARYTEWLPSRAEAANLIDHSKRYVLPPHLLGLRGLRNLGNTCYLNSAVQALLHNPFLRNYFLADSHNRRVCPRGSKEGCLGCELDYLFAHSFAGHRMPHTPHHLLYTVWRAGWQRGYSQEDAHEFVMEALNGLHAHCGGIDSPDCRCVVHVAFGGLLRSDVTCTRCLHTSTTFDPFFDISLDLPKRLDDTPESLTSCLRNFTTPEKLGSAEKCWCSGCNDYSESVKQLSIRRLPLVLCLHLKRFEQPSTKIDTPVSFPLSLNMREYLSEEVAPGVARPLPPLPDLHYQYDLFAVVQHQGTMDNGHYTSFVRHAEMWFKCDDAYILRATEQQVLAAKGYMLFYLKKHLHYSKPNKAGPTVPT